MRRLGIPRVLDRVLMQAIARVLGEIFNPTFSDNSFGYMPHRSVQQAARRAQSFYQQGYTIQIDIDLEKILRHRKSRRSYGTRGAQSEEQGSAKTTGSVSAIRRYD